MKSLTILAIICGLATTQYHSEPKPGPTVAQKPSEKGEEEDVSRQIVLEEFTKARPAAGRTRPSTTSLSKAARYRRKSPAVLVGLKASNASVAKIGITLWRLRPSGLAEDGARMLVIESGQSTQLTPVRVEADEVLSLGERVRLSIESARPGYLYVVDRERYEDGTLGDPVLIFPTTRTRGGDNRVKPGVLVDIPAQEDSTPYFTLKSNHPQYSGELLTVVIVSRPIQGLKIGPEPLVLPLAELVKWERNWNSQSELFEMVGGGGKPWTKAEQAAAVTSGARMLTQEGPAPQTVYWVAWRGGQGFMVNVPLRCRR